MESVFFSEKWCWFSLYLNLIWKVEVGLLIHVCLILVHKFIIFWDSVFSFVKILVFFSENLPLYVVDLCLQESTFLLWTFLFSLNGDSLTFPVFFHFLHQWISIRNTLAIHLYIGNLWSIEMRRFDCFLLVSTSWTRLFEHELLVFQSFGAWNADCFRAFFQLFAKTSFMIYSWVMNVFIFIFW